MAARIIAIGTYLKVAGMKRSDAKISDCNALSEG
jgi:hypothetical protein